MSTETLFPKQKRKSIDIKEFFFIIIFHLIFTVTLDITTSKNHTY